MSIPKDRGRPPLMGAASFPDLRITVELGATLPVTDYGNVKPLIRIEGVDPRGDVGRQIEIALETAGSGFAAIDQHFEQLLSEIMSPASGKPGFTARVAAIEKDNTRLSENSKWARESIVKLASRIREQEARIAELVAEKAAVSPGEPAEVVTPHEARVQLNQEQYDRIKAAEAQEAIGAHG